MIEPKLPEEVKIEFHGYAYCRPEDMQHIADAITMWFGILADDAKLHNVLFRTTEVNWEKESIPIYANEEEMPDTIEDDVMKARLNVLEVIDIIRRVNSKEFITAMMYQVSGGSGGQSNETKM